MAMARIMVSEADPDVRRLLVVLIERLGHEALVLDPDVEVPPPADLLLVEPQSAWCLDHARLVRTYFPDIPVLALNALPDGAAFLEREPFGYLQKPFTVEAMRATVQGALGLLSPV
jgi:CheY-like chemotaxis protein